MSSKPAKQSPVTPAQREKNGAPHMTPEGGWTGAPGMTPEGGWNGAPYLSPEDGTNGDAREGR